MACSVLRAFLARSPSEPGTRPDCSTQKGANGLITQNGSQGIYMFASQRLWRASPAGDGVSGFIQFGVNDSRTTFFATRYFGFGAYRVWSYPRAAGRLLRRGVSLGVG